MRRYVRPIRNVLARLSVITARSSGYVYIFNEKNRLILNAQTIGRDNCRRSRYNNTTPPTLNIDWIKIS